MSPIPIAPTHTILVAVPRSRMVLRFVHQTLLRQLKKWHIIVIREENHVSTSIINRINASEQGFTMLSVRVPSTRIKKFRLVRSQRLIIVEMTPCMTMSMTIVTAHASTRNNRYYGTVRSVGMAYFRAGILSFMTGVQDRFGATMYRNPLRPVHRPRYIPSMKRRIIVPRLV